MSVGTTLLPCPFNHFLSFVRYVKQWVSKELTGRLPTDTTAGVDFYATTASVGKQVVSTKSTAPAHGFGTSDREAREVSTPTATCIAPRLALIAGPCSARTSSNVDCRGVHRLGVPRKPLLTPWDRVW